MQTEPTTRERVTEYSVKAANTVSATELTGFLANISASAKAYDFWAIFIFLLQTFSVIYLYRHTENKNINEDAILIWSILRGMVAGVAALGILLATALFVMFTPLAVFCLTATETLRNFGFLLWNVGKLAALRFQLRKQLSNKDESDLECQLTKLKYEALKAKYIEKIQQFAKAFLIGLAVTIALTFFVVFPMVGLGALLTTGIVVLGAFITTKVALGIAVMIVPLLPNIYDFCCWAFPKIGNAIKNGFNKVASFFKKGERQPLLENQPKSKPKPETPKSTSQINLSIKDEKDIKKLLEHDLGVSTHTKSSRCREHIIRHINKYNNDTTQVKVGAKKVLQAMIDEKINALDVDMTGTNDRFKFFTKWQNKDRQAKKEALKIIQKHLEETPSADANTDQFEENKQLIKNIETKYPAVKKSYFKDESDTQNVVEAFAAYNENFVPRKAS